MAAIEIPPRPAARPGDGVSEAVMQRIARGDHRAFEELYDRTSKLVFTICARILPCREDAEEAALDTFTHVWTHASQFATRRGSVVAWLVTIARSRAIDRFRWAAVRDALSLDDVPEARTAQPTPEVQAMMTSEARRVRRALARVPDEQREVLELASGLGLTHRELAESLGLPLGTVKTRARLGLQRLRAELARDAAPGRTRTAAAS